MTKFLRLVFASSVAITLHTAAVSQSLSINTTGNPAHASAILDVESNLKGVLVPRMNKTDKNAIAAPANGLLVYQSGPDSIGFHYYDLPNTRWVYINASGFATDTIAWKTTGNTGTNITNHFLGTTDNVPLSFRQNNGWLGRWNKTTNNYFIGDSAGTKMTTGISNIAIGSKSLFENSIAFGNVAIGNASLYNNTAASRNIALGDSALYTQSYNPGSTYSMDNTAIGYRTLFFNQPTSTGTGVKNVAVGSEAMYFNTTGTENVAIGVSALRENISGYQNTIVGRSANRLAKSGFGNSYFGFESGYTDSIGTANTGIGAFSLASHQRNSANVAVGYASLFLDSAGANNSAVGSFSMYNNKRGHSNTAMGASSMFSIKYAVGNVAAGYQSLWANDSSHYNTAVGYTALYNHKRVGNTYNTALGSFAMEQDSIGYHNTGVGTSAFRHNVTGFQNTGVGINAGYYQKESQNTFIGAYSGFGERANGNYAADTGRNNTGLGTFSLYQLANGNNNVALGYQALYQDSSGSNNVAMGYQASALNDTASFTVAIGTQALFSNTVDSNVAIGYRAGYYANSNTNFLSKEQTFIGTEAGMGSFVSSKNTAIGFRALTQRNPANGNYTDYNNGGRNTAIGDSAMAGTIGISNVAIGTLALSSGGLLTLRNVAIGDSAMGKAIGPTDNVGIGYKSLSQTRSIRNTAVGAYSLLLDTTGNENTAVGAYTLSNSGNATGNTAFGYQAGNAITGGDVNTLLGYNADVSIPTVDNASAIGAYAYVGAANSMVLGSINGINGATANTKVGIGTTTPDSSLSIADNFLVGNSGTIQYDNTVPVMSYMFKTGSANADRMVVAHSPGANSDWGLQYQDATDQFNFLGNGVNRMAIELGSGQVGIGIAAPTTKLHIYEASNVNVNLRVASVSTAYEPGIELMKTGAGSDWRIQTATTGNLVFTRSIDDLVTPIDEYEMSSTSFRPFTDGTNSLGLAANRWTTVYATVGAINTSDARDKENITSLNYGLNEIMKLRPVSFNWKANPQWGKKIGFIAQEVLPILGEVVQVGDIKSKKPQTDDNGNALNAGSDKLGIYYSDIIPVAVKAIQEQQKIIEDLKKKNEQLEKDMQAIKTKLGINN